MLAGILIIGLLALAFRFFQPVNLLFTYLAVVSIGLTAIFFANMDMTSRHWSDWEIPEPDIEAVALSEQAPVSIIVFDALGGQVLFHNGGIDPNTQILLRWGWRPMVWATFEHPGK